MLMQMAMPMHDMNEDGIEAHRITVQLDRSQIAHTVVYLI